MATGRSERPHGEHDEPAKQQRVGVSFFYLDLHAPAGQGLREFHYGPFVHPHYLADEGDRTTDDLNVPGFAYDDGAVRAEDLDDTSKHSA